MQKRRMEWNEEEGWKKKHGWSSRSVLQLRRNLVWINYDWGYRRTWAKVVCNLPYRRLLSNKNNNKKNNNNKQRVFTTEYWNKDIIKKTVLLTFLHLHHTYYAKHIFARFIKGLHKTDFQNFSSLSGQTNCAKERQAEIGWQKKA